MKDLSASIWVAGIWIGCGLAALGVHEVTPLLISIAWTVLIIASSKKGG
jgi:hypothetical protein